MNNIPEGYTDSAWGNGDVKIKCTACGHVWWIVGYEDMGATFSDEEFICPECGEEGEIV